MKRFRFAGLMLFALLLAAPIASAQDGLPSCPGGSAYDLTGHGCVTGYTNGSAAAASSASKVAGLAAPALAQEQFVSCGFSEQLDPLLDPQALACLSQPIPAAKAASKPAGLAAPAQTEKQNLGWSGCPWGDAYDPMVQGYVPACFSRPTDDATVLKPAGLAKLTPVEGFVSCGAGGNLDPLLDPQALACLSQPIPAAKAASTVHAAAKPAGLAQPAPAVDPEQGLPCPSWGNAWDAQPYGNVSKCLIRPAADTAASRPPGLARPIPAISPEQRASCGSGENPDVLPVACLDGPGATAKAASKPAGLAAPAQEQIGACDAGESPNRCP